MLGLLDMEMFPLIQLPRKSEAFIGTGSCFANPIVSINSTSEEVRRGQKFCLKNNKLSFH